MDPLENLDLKGDTSFALALEAQKRGHLIYHFRPDDLFLKSNKAFANICKFSVSSIKNINTFEYGKREGTFDPCEFPETADRTLDPLQISSLSNRGDNPFWYMPGILTVDSTIHTSDGAPCQFISAENDRFNSIDLENDIVLIPENNQQEGKGINFTK